LRLTAFAQRPALDCWVNWWHETARIPQDVHDPGVAETKLHWWLNELRATEGGQPNHPLMRERIGLLLPPGASWPEAPLWLNQIEGLIQLVHQNRWMDEAHFVHHARQTTGLACEGAACLLGAGSEHAREAARLLGVGLRMSHRLARLGQDARAGWVMVGIDLLQTHDVKAHQLTKPVPGQTPPGWTPLLADLALRARQPLQEALGQIERLPAAQARALRPLVLLAHLALAQVEVVVAAGDAVLHQRLLLTPWRKAWIAQRVAWGWLR
jgi:phytoene synthase